METRTRTHAPLAHLCTHTLTDTHTDRQTHIQKHTIFWGLRPCLVTHNQQVGVKSTRMWRRSSLSLLSHSVFIPSVFPSSLLPSPSSFRPLFLLCFCPSTTPPKPSPSPFLTHSSRIRFLPRGDLSLGPPKLYACWGFIKASPRLHTCSQEPRMAHT